MEAGETFGHPPNLTPTVRGLTADRRMFGRFVLRQVLGSGGMGVVWLAWDEKLREEVALKFVPDLLRWNRHGFDELCLETKRTRTLSHPNIVRVYDVVESEEAAAIVMEYVAGQTLAAQVAARGYLDPAEIAGWIGPLCAALDYAHSQARLVHRDLKPSNVLLTRDGVPKIADFGVARNMADLATRVTGEQRGTVCYMSPQQQLGEPATPADDIYSLGVMLYELLAGKPPFHTGNIAAQIVHSRPASLNVRRRETGATGASVPESWEQAIQSCLAKDPRDRPVNGAELARHLNQTVEPGKEARRKRASWPLIVIGTLFLAAGACWWLVVSSGPGQSLPAKQAVVSPLSTAGFSDDFVSNFSGWLAWGEPRPHRIKAFQGREWLMDNNGDGMYHSGLTSLKRFEMPGGFTLESEVYLSVTNPAGCHCEAYVGLTRNPERWMNALGSDGDAGEGLVTGMNFVGDSCWGTPVEGRRHIWWSGSFFSEEGKAVFSHEDMPQEAQLVDDLANRWVRLRVQVDAERRVRFYANDRLMWAPTARLHPLVLKNQRIVLKGRSLGTAGKAYHDWVHLNSDQGAVVMADEAPARSEARVLTWTGADWNLPAGPSNLAERLQAATAEGELSLNSDGSRGEIRLNTRGHWRVPFGVAAEVQPLLQSGGGPTEQARVGLITDKPDGSTRFVGIEFASGDLWLVDSAAHEPNQRLRRMGGYSPGSWTSYVMQIDSDGRFTVTGSSLETFTVATGVFSPSEWRLELSVRDSGDGVIVRPVQVASGK